MVVDRLGIAGIGTAHMLDTTLAGASKDFVARALDWPAMRMTPTSPLP